MTEERQNTISSAAHDDAANWYARLSSGEATDGDIARHMEWLLEDPSHADAYEQVAVAMRAAGVAEDAARQHYAGDFVVGGKPALGSKLFGLFTWPQAATAFAAAAALLFFVIMPTMMPGEDHYGQQRYEAVAQVERVELADGSIMSLFGGSAATVTMSEDRRVVELGAGRAFFDVTSNKERPFFVRTGTHEVRVVGTRFEVVRAERFARVAVNEGLVSVSVVNDKDAAPLLINPGKVALYEAGGAGPAITEVAAATIGLWADGVLTFRQAHLGDVIEKIAAIFPEHHITLADEELTDLQFSGTLVVSNAARMVEQLGALLDLEVQVTDTEIRISRS
ncbi:MAG: FecR domain-containing protein [Alphaproteobacteria bacterium]|nr:FecR domain-containing protein [Alphaproteobacteria bacterium]